ncbi:hypothetical protein BsWGS_03993 [Bradybaena similaris]
MATYHGSGCQSPPTIGRTVDRIFEDAQFTGEIYLNGRKLRDYPKLCSKYDLSDTTLVDISRNRLTEVPHEVCEYLFVEKINCYHNVIRSIPENIQQLQVLTHLILSRNQMTVLPPALCMLGCLEVLHVSNNKLVSLPEEIRHLTSLMDLDVSCNELSHLPVQIGDLSSLRSLNLRRNFLVELPVEISRLQLYKLDFSSNRIEKIPTVFRKMQTLEQFILDNNPLTLPPAYICIKGRQHIMKFLHIEAIKEDRKRGILMGSDSDMKKFIRKSLPPPQSSDDLKNMLGGAESKWKRHTVLSNDSGYSTTDGSERNGWQSGEELKRQKAEYERKKKQAEIIRVQQEEEEEEREKEERRRAALKLQEDQKMIMQKQEEQRKHDEFQKQEELRRQEELKLIEGKRRKEEDESQTRDEDIQKLHDTVRIQEGEQIRMKGNTDKRAESKLLDKNNLINNGVAENSHQSSTSTTPSVSPSPSPRNSVSHLAKPNSPSSSTSHLAKPISPSGSTSHLVKPTGTKSAVPRAANGPAGPAQSQAVRKTKLAGDRSNTASPVTARSARTAAPGGLRTQGSGLSSAPSNLRRSSNSSIIDDEPKPRKGPTGAPVETSRLKAHLDEHNKKGTPLHTSAGKKSDHPPESVDTNKRVNTRPPTSTNIYGLGRGRPGGPKTLEDSSSNFTTHKKEEKEEAEQMDRLRQMVESRLRVTLPDNLAEALRDGVVLCHLANHVRPRSVGSIHVPSPAVPKLTLAKCRRNVDNFLDACKKIGVDQEQLCGPQDIFDEKGISRVAITVAALVAVGSSPRQSAV